LQQDRDLSYRDLMSQLVQHSSETHEHYTPEIITSRVHHTMRGIDLDPASSTLANQMVKATVFISEQEQGLLHRDQWRGRVFLNPPGGILDQDTLMPRPRNDNRGPTGKGMSSAAAWWAALVQQYIRGGVTEAVFVCFTMAVFKTAQAKAIAQNFGAVPPPYVFPFLVPAKRINYDRVYWHDSHQDAALSGWRREKTTGAPSDSAIVYLPDKANPDAGFARFALAFGDLGVVRE
jgi:hypothetical protein